MPAAYAWACSVVHLGWCLLFNQQLAFTLRLQSRLHNTHSLTLCSQFMWTHTHSLTLCSQFMWTDPVPNGKRDCSHHVWSLSSAQSGPTASLHHLGRSVEPYMDVLAGFSLGKSRVTLSRFGGECGQWFIEAPLCGVSCFNWNDICSWPVHFS